MLYTLNLRLALATMLVFLVVGTTTAVDIEFGVEAGGSTETPNPVPLGVSAGYDAHLGGVGVFGEVTAENTGIYGGYMGGSYGFDALSFSFGEAGIRYQAGSFSLGAGRLALVDIVDSPYSLFASGLDNVALGSSISYEDETFFYHNDWVALNYDLIDTGIPDRSAMIKSYGLKVGPFRLAFQDAAIMTGNLDGSDTSRGPLFDAEYFLLPLPGILVQYLGTSQAAPWQKTSSLNDNSIMGFMAEWHEGSWYAVGQILLDDVNMNRFLEPESVQNPDKIAWHLGSTWDSPWGALGLYHAGATKYTFQPYGGSGSNTQYGYTYYPFTSYLVDGVPMALEPEANYLGYQHGENNLAFMATWTDELLGATLAAALEFTLSGSKSPANPWHEFNDFHDDGQGTKFLDDAVLEKKLLLTASAAYPLGNWELGLDLSLGYVWNRLRLGAAPSADAWNNIPFYAPSDEDALIVSMTLGGRYRFSY